MKTGVGITHLHTVFKYAFHITLQLSVILIEHKHLSRPVCTTDLYI
jgi:hypothetical protein